MEQSSQRHTALLVFSLSPRQELERKFTDSLIDKGTKLQFFKELVRQTEQVSGQSGMDVLWFDESKQRGNHFGEKLINAISDVFALGYEKVISIGNDCAQLTASRIRHAAKELEKSSVVLGPADDGGLYLIGVNRNVYDVNAFKALPWLSPSLTVAFELYLENSSIAYDILPSLSDLDNITDIKSIWGKLRVSALRNILLKILHYSKIQIHTNFFQFLATDFRRIHRLRGPPNLRLKFAGPVQLY